MRQEEVEAKKETVFIHEIITRLFTPSFNQIVYTASCDSFCTTVASSQITLQFLQAYTQTIFLC